jgi:outer membrane protein assembly factor BamB
MPDPRGDLNWDALQALANESHAAGADGEDGDVFEDEAAPPAPPAAKGEKSTPSREAPARESASREAPPRNESTSASPPASAPAPLTDKVRDALRQSRVRPGQEDTLRSPLILSLGGGTAALILIGAVFHFMINRQTTEESFNTAKQLYEEGKFAPAITALTDFLALNGQSSFANEALIYRGRAEVDRQVITAKDYPAGLQKLRDFIDEFESSDAFELQREFVAEKGRLIALEAAQQAGVRKDESLLKTSDEARTIFSSYAAQDVKPKERIAVIEAAKRASQAEILRTRTGSEASTAINAALKKNDTLGAIAAWRNLVGRYDELRKDARIAGLLNQVLDAEKARVAVQPLEVTAAAVQAPATSPIVFTFHARSSTDEVSGGRCVLAVAKDCVYGVDTITGEPRWRHSIGLNAPYFPLVDSSTGTAVAFDSNAAELVKFDINTGKVLWRTPLEDRATASPLLVGGRLLVPTAADRLYDVDFGNGAITRRVQFSQSVSAPALMPGGERIALAGDQEFYYVLNLSALECERVQYLGNGHASGSIVAPLLPMGPYLLVCENQGDGKSSELHLLNAKQTSGELVEVASSRVQGLVVDPPVIRGQDLFVPSTGERVSAFTVSDVAGQPVLTVGPVYPGTGASTAPIYLLTGPERQVWVAGSAVRQLQITGDDLRANPKPEAVGIASQPLQYVDRKLFHGRRRAYTDAVTFIRMDRDTLVGDSQAVLGAKLLAWSVNDKTPPSVVVANEGGIAFRTTPDKWTKGGLQTTDAERLPLNEDLAEPIGATAMDKGQLAMAVGGPEPKLWVLNSVGKIDRSVPLTGGPTAPMAFMSGRVLVPQQGRLKLVSTNSGQAVVEDFTLPTEEMPTARWRYVAPTSDTDVVAALESGDVILARYQTSPRQFLGQVNRISLGAPLHVKGDQADGLVVLADGAGIVHLLDAAGLTEKGQRQLPAAVSNDCYLAGQWIFVETAGQNLLCLNRDEGLTDVWTLPLDGASLAGRPHVAADGLLLPLRDGRILLVNPQDGAVLKTIETGQSLAGGAIAVGTDLLFPTADGGLLRYEAPQP